MTEPDPDAIAYYKRMLAEMKKANFGHGMANQFSPFADTVRLPAVPRTPRFVLGAIEHKPGNLADQSCWQVILDFRVGSPGPQPSIAID